MNKNKHSIIQANFLEEGKKINFLKSRKTAERQMSIISDIKVVRKYTIIVHLLTLKKLKNELCVRGKYIWN